MEDEELTADSDRDLVAVLDAVADEARAAYAGDEPPGQAARMQQFEAHLATARMALEHLADEARRHAANPRAHLKARGEYIRED